MRAYVIALAAAFSAPSFAAPVVDGSVNPGEYGAPTAVVLTDPTAPNGNFGNPSNLATAGYNIYLTSANDTLFGAIVQTGGVRDFIGANLYFDLDPTTANNGSDMGIEVGNLRGFVPGGPAGAYFDLTPFITVSQSVTDGLATFEFSISNEAFRTYIALGQAQGQFSGYVPQDARLNLSQAMSYSVAGGQAFYGNARLGTFGIGNTAAVPEPATWAMMMLGFGAMGAALRRRGKIATTVRYA